MDEAALRGKVALVTGAAAGIGAAVAGRLAGLGAHVVVADIDEDRGRSVADALDGLFVRCDVSDPDQSRRAVEAAVDRFGGLDVAHLNAGIGTGCGIGDDFDIGLYRRAISVNLDGVVFGLHAALPALRARRGGTVVATASLAGLVPAPPDPVYATGKHAVVGLVRSAGPALAGEGIRVMALCPGFADTDLVKGIRDWIDAVGAPLIPVSDVVDAFMAMLARGEPGECWYVQAGRPSEPFRFRNVPGPRPVDPS